MTSATTETPMSSAAEAIRGSASGFTDFATLVSTAFANTTAVRVPPPAVTSPRPDTSPPVVQRAPHQSLVAHAPPPPDSSTGEGLGTLRKGARDMLGVLAQVHPRRLTRSQWALLTGVKQGSTFSTYLSVLRTRQLITEEGGTTGITDDGLALIGDTVEPLDSNDLIERWSVTLRAGARRMFLELVAAYPNPVSRDRLAEVCGSDSPNTLNTYMSVLRSAGLADITADEACAAADLFV